ncbi:hypothetical protein K1719_013608 [Acacia pycnantha]|nr:hypothetical protein K1719_013608 [Acacia pycnantha]
MAELVAGAFLSSFLQVAFERLASPDFLDYFRRKKMDDGLLKKLHAILLSVDKIVEDAEERQYRDRRVKQWLDELKDEVFKAQDLLDDIATEALRQKQRAESQTAASGKVRGFFTSLVNRNQLEKKIESGIKEVINNLENLIKQNEILGLRGGSSLLLLNRGAHDYGLIYPTHKSLSLEEAGNEIFNDLESRSFFEPSRNGDDYFIMHDLVNNLAKSVTQEFLVQLEVD